MAKRNKSKFRKVGLDAKGRVDYQLQENKLCLELAKYGFYARTISRKTGLSENQIRYRLKQQAIYINDYRDGKSETATIIFRKFKVED
jgi:hypothetical protein